MSRPRPGTPEFRAALVQALTEVDVAGHPGDVRLDEGEWASRNTVVYRGTVGSRRVVAKAQSTKPPSVVVAEYRMLCAMEQVFTGIGVRSLRPVAVFEELGALVTVEEGGDSLRGIIESDLDHGGLERSVRGVDAAARALRMFHDAYPPARDAAGGETSSRLVRQYLDFGPKNLLIQGGEGLRPAVVLMDAPEEERWGDPWRDVGGFCFDLARIRFLPRFALRPAVSIALDHLKAVFIRGYCATLGTDPEGALPSIRDGERARASQAMGWYLDPWRFRSPVKEVLRLAYLGPLTARYRAAGIDRSYQTVRMLLERGEAWWEGFLRHPAIG